MSLNNQKPLYQPWNEDEFQSDVRVQKMNDIQRWCYRSLLNASFFCSTRPYLPDDDDLLWRLAGCDSKKKWMKNRDTVVSMFQAVKKKGLKLLAQKRVVIDWSREKRRKEEISEKQRARVNKRWQKTSEHTTVIPENTNKQNCTEQTELNCTEQTSEDEMSFKSNITDKAREILGTRISPQDRAWDEMRSLARIYKQSAVEDAFEDWASTRRGETLAYPLSEFVKVADGLLRGISTVIAAPEAKDLVNDLVFMCNGEITFDQKQQIQIGKLLQSWNEIDIKSAFREFYGQIDGDDFAMKFGAKNFVEKAEQLLTLQKRRQDDTKKQNELTVRIMNEQRGQAEKEIAAVQKQQNEVDMLVEDTLGG